MRRVGAFVWLLLAACAPRVRSEDEARDRRPCSPVSTVQVAPRVDGGHVLVESVLTRHVCEGEDVVTAPVRLAELRLRPDLPACPIGTLGARRWPGGFSFEAPLSNALDARQRDRLQTELTDFTGEAQAYVIGCTPDGLVEWLFVEVPRANEPPERWTGRVAFFDGRQLRAAPGHENVVLPSPPPPPPTPAPPPDDPGHLEEGGIPEEPERAPPTVTATGCPAERIDAQWLVRRNGPHRLPGPETMDRWWLRLDGGTATLVHEQQRRPKRGPGEGVWACSNATTVQGRITRRGRTVVLTFGGLVAACTKTVVSLAPATAKRHPTPQPQREEEEGCDRFRWATARRVSTPALVCTGDLPLEALRVFGPPPGIERLSLENDCADASDQASMRLIPADGSLAPPM